jgi:hypothetical protein
VENQKINVVFGLVVIAFLLVTFMLVKDFKAKRDNDKKEYSAMIANIVKMKNDKIIILSNRLKAEEKENADLKSTLADTKNGLDALSKKLPQPASVAASASVPAAAAAAK